MSQIQAIRPTNILPFPLKPANAYDEGCRAGRNAVICRQSYQLAYSVAIVDSVTFRCPSDYINGFVSTFRAESEKEALA